MKDLANPPAFPTTMPLDGWGDPNKGMSLRDWFAGQAIAGYIATGDKMSAHAVAREAYMLADAMLAAGCEGREGRSV